LELQRDGLNAMTVHDGELSPEALTVIGGLCHHAEVLTAFGNTMAASYLRLVPNQEAPTRICWSDMNRSALIRVPLAWSRAASLANQVNPPSPPLEKVSRQTVELRTPDGSALVHLLLSAITRIADEAFDDPTSAETARKRYVTAAGLKDQRVASTFPQLPGSCAEAASLLQRRRMLFEKEGMFPREIIDYVLNLLRGEDDSHMARELWELGASDRDRAVRQLLHRDLHRH
jgi:glutamine synthetase